MAVLPARQGTGGSAPLRGRPGPIPVLDSSDREHLAALTARVEPARLALLLDSGRRTYTALGLRVADSRTRAWASRLDSPYAKEVIEVANGLGRPGAFLLNYSYEWGCTSGAGADPLGGMTLSRTLDWPFDGLGRALIVVRRRSGAGPYFSVTWPGFAGVLSGLAPGRFAAAINQPPLPLPALGKPAGWLAARVLVSRSHAMPPDHLLRLAFETCQSFSGAMDLIRRTPICMPAIFTLAGPETGEAIVIERTRCEAFQPGTVAAANHWASPNGPAGVPRNRSSRARRDAMIKLIGGHPDWSLDWLRPPILQPDTRMAMMANPASGRLVVQGWETGGAATEVLNLR